MDSPFIVQRDDGPKVYGIHQVPELENNHRRNNCGGHLASITNPEEYDMVVRLLQVTLGNRSSSRTTAKVQRSDGLYLGAHRESGPNGEFISGDGSQPFFVNWREGFPNDDIVLTTNNNNNHNGEDGGSGSGSGRIPRKREVVIHLNDFLATNEQDTQKRRAVVLLPLNYLEYDGCGSRYILQGF